MDSVNKGLGGGSDGGGGVVEVVKEKNWREYVEVLF
jgi:hypothetical protein